MSSLWQSISNTPASRLKQISLCWLWFFLVLFGYYVLKPLRDAIGTPLAANLGDIYLATFLVTIVVLAGYSQLVASLSRTQVVHVVYHLTTACLVGFYFAFEAFGQSDQLPFLLAGTFFVWLSVFNLLVVTVFWSVMADVFTSDEGKLWFGSMAAAGTLGSLTASIAATMVARHFGPNQLLLVSMAAFEFIVLTSWFILRAGRTAGETSDYPAPATGAAENEKATEQGTGGTFVDGAIRVFQSPYLFAICGFVLLGKFGATFVYNNLQNTLNAEAMSTQARTVLFAQMNIWTQSCTFVLQAVGVSLLMRFLGMGATLAIPCAVVLGMFVWLTMVDSLNSLVVSQVIQGVLAYGLLAPAQNVLFTVVSREDKYKTKAFIDLGVFRASDVAAGKTCQWMTSTGTAVAILAAWMMPIVLLWTMIALYLGIEYRRRQSPRDFSETNHQPH